MIWERDEPSVALLNAAKGFGYVAARRAMDKAIDKAESNGIGMVGVRDSNHFGIAGYHALRAASRGLIGWAATNAGAEMAPTGSAEPVLGTNPWGIAIPRPKRPPILLDMALTMSGKGMMRWLAKAGLPMPSTWALTSEGRATTDPAAALDGPLLPIGDYKGYGLSLFTDVLAGVMTGALFGRDVFKNDEHYDVGHVLLAVRPDAFVSRESYEDRLENLIAQVKSASPIRADSPVLLPGELQFARREQRLARGVPVSEETVSRLRELSSDVGVPFPL
jgi:LDH2 family malate/lactate/ureidoglycolate dehydrogenase